MKRASAMVAATVVVFLAGCAAPPMDPATYRKEAASAAKATVSEARTVHLVSTGLLADRVSTPFAFVVIGDSDAALTSIIDGFADLEPSPTGVDDKLRSDTLDQLGKLADAVAAVRLAVHRDDRAAVTTAVKDLARVEDAVEKLGESG